MILATAVGFFLSFSFFKYDFLDREEIKLFIVSLFFVVFGSFQPVSPKVAEKGLKFYFYSLSTREVNSENFIFYSYYQSCVKLISSFKHFL